MVSKFHNGIYDSKGHEHKIKTIVKGRETFYRRHIVLAPVISCSEAIYVFKRSAFNSDLKTKCLSELYMLVLNPTEHVLLWMILGIEYTTKVKLELSVPYRLPVLIYICIFWGACTDSLTSKRNNGSYKIWL